MREHNALVNVCEHNKHVGEQEPEHNRYPELHAAQAEQFVDNKVAQLLAGRNNVTFIDDDDDDEMMTMMTILTIAIGRWPQQTKRGA